MSYSLSGSSGQIRQISVPSFGEQMGGAVVATKTRLWEEAERETKEKVALKLIEKGFDSATIIEITERELKDIEQLRQLQRPLAG